ncbi:MAG: hypothetical protein MI923_20070 [Phycisphaerales bacterium]|nr:hypothetical protein [Phycisphaerales bacterium]
MADEISMSQRYIPNNVTFKKRQRNRLHFKTDASLRLGPGKNVPVFLYGVTMLIFKIKRIISSEKWFKYVVPFFIFFENAKNLGQSHDAQRRKKRGWPYEEKR